MHVPRIIALLAATVLLQGCTATQLSWWRAADADDQSAVTEWIVRNAAGEFDVDARVLLALAVCESGMNPAARNQRSTAAGLFQYLDTTWDAARTRLHDRGIDAEPYSVGDVFNPTAAARVTANVVAEGGLSWWECAPSARRAADR